MAMPSVKYKKVFGLYPGLNQDRLRSRHTPSQLSYAGIVKEFLHVVQSNYMAIMVPAGWFLVCTVFYQPAKTMQNFHICIFKLLEDLLIHVVFVLPLHKLRRV